LRRSQNFYQTTRRHNPENHNLNIGHCKNSHLLLTYSDWAWNLSHSPPAARHGRNQWNTFKDTIKIQILTEHHTMRMYREMDMQVQSSLTLAIAGGEWSASCSGLFILTVRAPGIYWIRWWVGQRSGLDAAAKRKITTSLRNQTPLI
jgi:hypothetical protein